MMQMFKRSLKIFCKIYIKTFQLFGECFKRFFKMSEKDIEEIVQKIS